MRQITAIAIFVLFAPLMAVAAGPLVPIPEDAVLLQPGVWEWQDENGIHRRAEGAEGLAWVLDRVQLQIDEVARLEPTDENAELLGSLIRQQFELMNLQEEMESEATAKAGCFCRQVATSGFAFTGSGYLPFSYAQAAAEAYECAGWTYSAMTVAVAVSSTSQKTVDLDCDNGATLDIGSAASYGYAGHRCLYAQYAIWINKPAGCTDGYVFQEDSLGDYPADCWFSPCM